MNASRNIDENLLRRRKSMVSGMVVLTVVVMLGFIVGSWQFLQKMENFLEEELGQRLLSIATLTANVIESAEYNYDIESGRANIILPNLTSILKRVHAENQLQAVYLVDLHYKLYASSQQLFSFGDRLFFLEEDSLAVSQAMAGAPAVSKMQIVEGNRFKNGYAPVFGPLHDVVAIVVVQASADFFDLLKIFQNGLIIGGLVSGTLVVLFSLFLFWAISSLTRAHESLRKSERLAAMGQMAATVAHEIRNPLGIIKGTADVLRSKYEKNDASDELFDYIPSEVRRLNRLVSDFLTFARDRELECHGVDLKTSVEKSLLALDDELRKAEVTVNREFEDIPAVPHDEDAVSQLMLNFVLNAIQAMDKKAQGEITVRLKNDHKKAKRYVTVEIEDNGCGFDESNDDIFEPFFTTKTSGSGLGLAICKRIVEKHRGWIDVNSQKGKGTKISFSLPVS